MHIQPIRGFAQAVHPTVIPTGVEGSAFESLRRFAAGVGKKQMHLLQSGVAATKRTLVSAVDGISASIHFIRFAHSVAATRCPKEVCVS